MANAYEPITNTEFERRLIEKLDDMSGEELILTFDTLFSDASEYFNNEIREEYEGENDRYMSEDDCLASFLDGMDCGDITEVKDKYNDDIALREDYNNYTDMLCKDGQITQYLYDNMDNPF